MNELHPMDIEQESFRIITEELEQYDTTHVKENELPIMKRVIHTTADFSYVENLCFSENVVEVAHDLLRKGANIVTDTSMAQAGINKKALGELGCEVHCFIGDSQVAKEAKQRNVTRSLVAVEKAKELSPLIYVVGNAPTALIGLQKNMEQGLIAPQLIIAVPVGFVNVVESKELIMRENVPYIVAKGRKGGSNVAASIVNALMYQLTKT